MAEGNLGFDINPGGTRLVIAQLVFLILAWMAGLLRAQVKLFITRSITIDDFLMLVALLLYTGYAVIDVNGVASGGTGKHTSELTAEGVAVALRAWYLCEVLYAPISALIRTSIALFLLRLVINKWHIWIIRVNLVVIWVISTVYFFLTMLQCRPPSYFWEGPSQKVGATGSCMDHNIVPTATVAHSIIGAVSDWVLGLLPIAILWNVTLNRRTKAGVALLLSMGLVAGIALLIRIPYVKKIAISADFLHETINIAVWAVIEPGLGIVAGCMATIRPLFRGMGLGLTRSSGNRYRAGGRGSASTPKLFFLSRRQHGGVPNMRRGGGGGTGPPGGSNVSELELRQSHSPDPKYVRTGSKGPTWNIEAGSREEAMDHSDGISIHTSFNVSTYRAGDSQGDEHERRSTEREEV